MIMGGKQLRSKGSESLPGWSIILLPLFVALIPLIVGLSKNEYLLNLFKGEVGLVEMSTLIFLACGIYYSLRIIVSHQRSDYRGLLPYVAVLGFGCFFFLGEEASWGQHLIGWQTPEAWQRINDQGETNIHNTIGLFDQVPRTLLSLFALSFGIVLPLYYSFKRKSAHSNSFLQFLTPANNCIVVTLCALLITMPKKFIGRADISDFAILSVPPGEVKECLLGLFLALYLASIYVKVVANKTRAVPLATNQQLKRMQPFDDQ